MTTATPSPLFATWLGYLTVILAFSALLGVIAATLTRRADLERWTFHAIIATAVSVAATTMVALSVYMVSRTSQAVYNQVFLAASLFTLAVTLAGWRQGNSDVLWKAETRVLYLAGYVGCLGLALALVWMG